MSAESFLNSLKKNMPETLKSPDSNNVYSVIAEKNGSKLGISVLFGHSLPAKYKNEVVNSCGLVVRLIQSIDEANNLNFPSAGQRDNFIKFTASDDSKITASRGEKSYYPVTYWPCSFPEFMGSAAKQQVFEELAVYVKNIIAKDGGTLLVDDATLMEVLKSKFLNVDIEPIDLFQSPNTKALPAPDAD